MLALSALTATLPVRAEPVETRPSAQRPSTSSGRTAVAREPRTAIEAERAFAADAQAIGQWAAFQKWATAEAIMFLPQPAPMQDATRDWPEPPRAVRWQPAASYVSCDRGHAANTGPWQRPNGTTGYFSTLWVRQPAGGWRWTIDGGDQLARPRRAPARPRIVVASCRGTPTTVPAVRYREGATGEGQSADRTLAWRWHVTPAGARRFDVWQWDGRTMRAVIADRIEPPRER